MRCRLSISSPSAVLYGSAPTLFRGLSVLVSPHTSPARGVLEELLYLAGANLVIRPADAALIIGSERPEDIDELQQQLDERGEGSKRRGWPADAAASLPGAAGAPPSSVAPAPVSAPIVRPTWLYDSLTHFLVMPVAAYLAHRQGEPLTSYPCSPQL
jgi:hypothetical protein